MRDVRRMLTIVLRIIFALMVVFVWMESMISLVSANQAMVETGM